MTQADLERAVARATGETRQLIRTMGFSCTGLTRRSRRRRNAAGAADLQSLTAL